VRRRAAVLAGLAAAGAVAGLAMPAGAGAARYSVKSGGGTCGASDTTCGSLATAASAMRTGDTLTIAPGRYDESPRFEAPGLRVRGSKVAPGVVINGTVTFAGSGERPSVLEKLAVSTSIPGAQALLVAGSSGVAVRDAALYATDGNALTIAGSTGNAVTRSRLLSSRVAVALGGGSVTLDSSIVSGGAGPAGAGVTVGAAEYSLFPRATISARHVTIAGAPAAIAPSPGASATVGVSDSIVLGAAPATVAFTRTDRASAPAALFVNPATRNFRLRPGSPALDRGQITAGDSPFDIDDQPRTLGRASDLGADELDLIAPRVTITRPRGGQRLAVGRRLRLAGRAQDPSGVASVAFSLEVLPASGGTCRWFSPQRGVVSRSCTEPLFVRAKLANGGRWFYDGPVRLKLPAARYRVRVTGADRAGVDGNAAPARGRSVTFEVG
jgi:hypothetical protein